MLTRLRIFLLLLTTLSVLPNVWAQETPLKTANVFDAMDMRGIPQCLQGKDLTSAWRMIVPENLEQSGMRISRYFDDDSPRRNVIAPTHYTRGDVISLGKESFLVTYTVQPESDPQKLRRKVQREQLRANRGEKPDTRIEESASLVLSLLNLKTVGNLVEIRAFDPARDVLTEADKLKNKVKNEREDSQMNLKQVALAVLQYAQDYDELLPPMRPAKSAAQIRNAMTINSSDKSTPVQAVLSPYARSVDIFLHPVTGRPYLPNWRISRMNFSQFNDSASTILFYEDAPDAENKRNIAFLDGHVAAVDEDKWKRMAKAAKLPP